MRAHRIEGLSDGIFAIAMTILVLQIQVPDHPGITTSADLWRAIVKLGPNIAGYVVSFMLLGTLWVGHHSMFHFIRHVDRPFLWLTIVFLMGVAFVPFTTALFAEYHQQPIASAFYGGTILCLLLISRFQWDYATGARRLVETSLEEEVVHGGKKRLRYATIAYLIAVAGSFWSSWLGLVLFVGVPLTYMLPSRVDAHLSQHPQPGP
jgi:uncharacterized membrane protein